MPLMDSKLQHSIHSWDVIIKLCISKSKCPTFEGRKLDINYVFLLLNNFNSDNTKYIEM